MKPTTTIAVVLVTFAVAGCRTKQTIITPDPHLERMLSQEKRLAYDPDPVLPKGMAMQQPPSGTLPVNADLADPLVTTGVSGGRWAATIPVKLTRNDLEDGRNHFETFCSPCHGILGDGNSVVAEKMALVKPRNLEEPSVVDYPDGRIFQTIREGYGLMPSYAVQLSVEDTWHVVGYVRALQLSRAAKVADLPADVRAQLAKEAP